ncbi:MAG: hypothetical protein R2867_00820 [Caldilineaceae bacterium]
MSGILLPGQNDKPQSQDSGLELPKGFSSRRERTAKPSEPAADPAQPNSATPPEPAAPTPAEQPSRPAGNGAAKVVNRRSTFCFHHPVHKCSVRVAAPPTLFQSFQLLIWA